MCVQGTFRSSLHITGSYCRAKPCVVFGRTSCFVFGCISTVLLIVFININIVIIVIIIIYCSVVCFDCVCLACFAINMFFSCNGTFACTGWARKPGTCLEVDNSCMCWRLTQKVVPCIIVFSSLSRVRLIAYFECRHIEIFFAQVGETTRYWKYNQFNNSFLLLYTISSEFTITVN